MALLGVQCRKTPPGLLRLGARGALFSLSATRQGGRAGRDCEIFLDQLCSVAAASQSERMAFRIYALQRLHAATFRGVAMLINSRPLMRTGPEVPQEASSLPVPPPPPRPVPPPPPRPVINSTTNPRSPHHAGCEENTFTNIHVPFIATARATPGT